MPQYIEHKAELEGTGTWPSSRPSLDVWLRYADHDFREDMDEIKPYMPTVKPRPGQGMLGGAHAVGGKGRLIFLTLVVVLRYHTRVVNSDSVPRP